LSRTGGSGARRVLAWAALAAALAAGADQARAHAVLLGSEPENRAVLADAPARIVLRFNEPVTPILLRVLDGDGRPLALPSGPRSVDREVVADLPAGLARGTYVISYRVTSADGHPVGGSILFAVGSAPRMWNAVAAETAAGAWADAAVVNRALHLLLLFVAAGGLMFRALARPPPVADMQLGRVAAAAAATALLGAYLHAAMLAGGGDPSSAAFWRAVRASPQTHSALASLGGLALAFAFAPRLGRGTGLVLGLVGAAIALAASGVSGHSAAAGAAWWPVAALHLVAAGYWFGSLPPLLRAVRRLSPGAAAPVLIRFSRVAVAAVAILVLAGAAMALQRLDNLEALTGSDYGLLILAKIAGAACLLALAGWNKLRLTPGLADSSPVAGRHLRVSIGAEVLIMGLVVAIAAVLAHTDPRAGGESGHNHHHHPPAPGGITLRIETGGRTATIEIRPAKPGRNTVTAAFAGADGAPLAALEATLELALPAAGIEPFTIKLARSGEGRFAGDVAELALPGRWRLRLDALISDFEKAIFRGEVEIR
jgi:copper transport protein